MLVLETIAKIRLAYFQHGKSIKQICRDLKVSRNVVRRVVRSGETEFNYERTVQPQPKIGPFRKELDRLLEENVKRSRRERLTLVRIYEELRNQGYDGGYDAVRRYATGWKQRETEVSSAAFVPLSFAPGEAFQFDWSHEIMVIDGATTTVKVAHVRLCHSRMMYVRAYPRETQEMVFDAHDKAFAFFGGACARGIYDNMKTVVDALAIGKDRVFNRRFVQMCSHHLIEPTACTPASGWEKGQVENQVGVVRRRWFTPRLKFKSYAELNAWLEDRCTEWAKAHPHPEVRDKTIWEMFEAERPSFVPYIGPFDGFKATPAAVSKTCLVRFDNNKYSVMASAVGRPVEIRAYAERVEFWQDGKVVGTHGRAFGRGKAIYDPWHYVPVLARKPGALRNGTPFKEWELPPSIERVRRKLRLADNGDRQMVDILVAVLTDGLDVVEAACAEALAGNVHSSAVILNILARRREPSPALTIDTPDALQLSCEPVADCARYDSLRRHDHGTLGSPRHDEAAEALRHEGGL